MGGLWRARGWGWTVGVAAILILGGGNAAIPLPRILAQLIAVPMCIYALSGGRGTGKGVRLRGPDWLVLALFVLCVIHLIPLPGEVWSDLPGRYILGRVDLEVFGALRSRSLSIVPADTVRALLFLIAPLAGYLSVAAGDAVRRDAVLRGITLALAVAFLVAAAQMLAPNLAWIHPYPGADYPLPIGFFGNRNHHADFLLCALPLAIAWLWRNGLVRPRVSTKRLELLSVVLAANVAIFVAATASRAGVALLPPTVIACFLALWLGDIPKRVLLTRLALVLAAFAGIILVLYITGGDRVFAVTGRGAIIDDNRLRFWPTVWAAAVAYWPWGAGIGTFQKAYEIIEPIGALRELYLNHAHNDYLEISVEAGLPGILLVGAAILWIVKSIIRAWRDPTFMETRLSTISLVVVFAHSLVDYPARTIAIATTSAVALALTRKQSAVKSTAPPSGARPWRSYGLNRQIGSDKAGPFAAGGS